MQDSSSKTSQSAWRANGYILMRKRVLMLGSEHKWANDRRQRKSCWRALGLPAHYVCLKPTMVLSSTAQPCINIQNQNRERTDVNLPQSGHFQYKCGEKSFGHFKGAWCVWTLGGSPVGNQEKSLPGPQDHFTGLLCSFIFHFQSIS